MSVALKFPESIDWKANIKNPSTKENEYVEPCIDEPETFSNNSTYPRQQTIAVDVDQTLLVNGSINQELKNWCINQKKKGFFMILWSARGQKHAERVAKIAGLEFDCIISKPGHIVDDLGWDWIKYTQVILP